MLNAMKDKIKKCTSKNLKSGDLKENELSIYDTKMTDADIIMRYQSLLPVLQQDGSTTVNARDLHNQLGSKRQFADWIKEQIDKYGFEENIDFSISQKCEKPNKSGGRPSIEYNITISTAKELAMVQNNDMGRIARKYFIAIESAYKNREDWNYDRADSVISCKRLKQGLIKYNKQLCTSIPSYTYNVHQAEFCLFNNIIIGTSATEYRRVMGLKKTDAIRNTFNEKQLEYIAELERYDADLILVQNIFNYDKRYEILEKKYKQMA